MKLVYSSDWHLDANTAGVRRIGELERAVDCVMQAAKHADLFIFGGDLCDPDSGSIAFECMRIAVHAALKLAAEGVESFWLSGNHCVLETGTGGTTLAPLKGIPSQLIHVVDRPLITRIKDVEFCFLPFTASSHTYDPAAFVAGVGDLPGHLVVVGHLMIRGMQPGEETLEMPRGRDIWFPDQEIFDERKGKPTIVLAGHYHRGGTYATPSGLEVHIPGSLARLRFGPEEDVVPAFIELVV